jgi:hypothetical protein
MPKDKAIAIATDKCSREKHSTQSTSPPWSNEKIAINKKQVSSQLLKCCKNTRHGAGGGTLRSNHPLPALRAARPDCFRSPAGQNAPQDRFVSPASSPVRLNQTQRHPTGASVFGASGDTAFFKKHSNINGFRTPEQRNYLYSALLKPSISAAIARFIFR